MSEIAVIKKSDLLLQESQHANDAALEATKSDTLYLPYIQLMYGTSGLVAEGKMSMAHFALIAGKNPVDLGKSFDCVILGWRPRAMEYGESTISIFNVENPEFARIKEQAVNRVRNFSYGKEFLLYLPDYDQLVCFFFGSLTTRSESPNVTAILQQQSQGDDYIVAKIESNITGKKDRYPVPLVSISESVLTKMPSDERLRSALNIFNNPKDTAVEETVEEDSRDR